MKDTLILTPLGEEASEAGKYVHPKSSETAVSIDKISLLATVTKCSLLLLSFCGYSVGLWCAIRGKYKISPFSLNYFSV